MEKAFKECKLVLNGVMLDAGITNKNIFEEKDNRIYDNPNFIDFIETNYLMSVGLNDGTRAIANKDLLSMPNEERQRRLSMNEMPMMSNKQRKAQRFKQLKQFDANYSINWERLCANPSSSVAKFFEKHWSWFMYNANQHIKWNWVNFCSNPAMAGLLNKHWNWLIANNKISWHSLCNNPKSVEIFKSHHKQIIAGDLVKYIKWELMVDNIDAELLELYWDWIINTQPAHIFERIFNYCLKIDDAMIQFIENHWSTIGNMIDVKWVMSYIHRFPLAIDFIKRHWNDYKKNPSWVWLCANSAAVELIEEHWDELVNYTKKLIHAVFTNHLTNNIELQLWSNISLSLCYHSGGIDIFERRLFPLYVENNWQLPRGTLYISSMVPFIEKHWTWLEQSGSIGWNHLLCNPGALSLIMAHKEVLAISDNLTQLCYNSNPKVIDIIENNYDEFIKQLKTTSGLPQKLDKLVNTLHAYEFIDQHWDDLVCICPDIFSIICCDSRHNDNPKLHWIINKRIHQQSPKMLSRLLSYEHIFDDEYHAVAIKWVRFAVTEELMARIWHPRNIARFASWGIDTDV